MQRQQPRNNDNKQKQQQHLIVQIEKSALILHAYF